MVLLLKGKSIYDKLIMLKTALEIENSRKKTPMASILLPACGKRQHPACGAVFVFKSNAKEVFFFETRQAPAFKTKVQRSQYQPSRLHGLSVPLPQFLFIFASIRSHYLGQSQRDYAGCLHTNSHHFHYCSHCHRFCGTADDELFPF